MKNFIKSIVVISAITTSVMGSDKCSVVTLEKKLEIARLELKIEELKNQGSVKVAPVGVSESALERNRKKSTKSNSFGWFKTKFGQSLFCGETWKEITLSSCSYNKVRKLTPISVNCVIKNEVTLNTFVQKATPFTFRLNCFTKGKPSRYTIKVIDVHVEYVLLNVVYNAETEKFEVSKCGSDLKSNLRESSTVIVKRRNLK